MTSVRKVQIRRADPKSEQINAELVVQLFRLINEARSKIENTSDPDPRSEFAVDFGRCPSFPSSVAINFRLWGAFESLRDLERQTIVVEQDGTVGVNTFSMLTMSMIRQALDLAVLGAWMLDAPTADERIRRVLMARRENARLERAALVSFGQTPKKTLTDVYSAIQEVATDAKLGTLQPPKGQGNLPSTTKMLEELEHAGWTGDYNLKGAWQLASAFAHGAEWAFRKVADIDEPRISDVTRSTTYRTTISFATFAAGLGATYSLLQKSVDRYCELSS